MIDCGCLCFVHRDDPVCLGEVERPDAVIANVRGFPIMMCRPCGERHTMITDAEAIKLAEKLDRPGASWRKWFVDQIRGRI
jgi:hypothetical protein